MISTLSDDSIMLHYQPLVDGRGKVVGFESLMRWYHQRRGLISPEAFIPIFENCGLIVPLSRWTLRQACLDAARWKWPLKVSVNVSPLQLFGDELPSLVADVLDETGLAPDRLELEVTEAVVTADPARTLAVLQRLGRQGVRIALDDAGNGVTLPFLLQDYPFSTIKIDRDVVAQIETSATARSVVHFITLAGSTMHVPVTAKGVETTGQLTYLRQQGCDLIQGYLLGRAAPIESFSMVTGNAPSDAPPAALAIPWPVEALLIHADESASPSAPATASILRH